MTLLIPLSQIGELPIEQPDLRRVIFYSNLVAQFHLKPDKTLTVGVHPNSGLMPPHLCLLIRFFLPSGLLPSLQKLVISNLYWFQAIHFMHLGILIPQKNLSQIVIDGGVFADKSTVSILRIAKLRAPMLAGLTVHGIREISVINAVRYFPNLKRINLEFSNAYLKLDHNGSNFANLTDLSLTGNTKSIHNVLSHLFSCAPILQNLTISLTPMSAYYDPDYKRGKELLLEVIQTLTKNNGHLLKTLVIHSPSHNPYTRLHFNKSLFAHFGRSLGAWNQLTTLSIPIDALALAYEDIGNLGPCNTSLENLTVDVLLSNSSPNLIMSLWVTALMLRTLFPTLKTLAAPVRLRMNDVEIKRIESVLSKGVPVGGKCYALEELTLLPFSTELTTEKDDRVIPRNDGAARDPFNPNAIFVFPETYHPRDSFTDLFLLSRILDHFFPHLKKINVERLYEFGVNRSWLDGLEVGLRQVRELVRQGKPNVCPRCNSWV